MQLVKPYTKQEYIDFIAYCNSHNCVPVDKGDYIEAVENLPTLDEAKTNKIAELKSARDNAERVPVVTDKGTFDVDSVSLERINGAITVLKISQGTLEWTLANNTVVDVTADDLTNVIVALAQQSNSVHQKYRVLKEQVDACTTVDEVQAIAWDSVDDSQTL